MTLCNFFKQLSIYRKVAKTVPSVSAHPSRGFPSCRCPEPVARLSALRSASGQCCSHLTVFARPQHPVRLASCAVAPRRDAQLRGSLPSSGCAEASHGRGTRGQGSDTGALPRASPALHPASTEALVGWGAGSARFRPASQSLLPAAPGPPRAELWHLGQESCCL